MAKTPVSGYTVMRKVKGRKAKKRVTVKRYKR